MVLPHAPPGSCLINEWCFSWIHPTDVARFNVKKTKEQSCFPNSIRVVVNVSANQTRFLIFVLSFVNLKECISPATFISLLALTVNVGVDSTPLNKICQVSCVDKAHTHIYKVPRHYIIAHPFMKTVKSLLGDKETRNPESADSPKCTCG